MACLAAGQAVVISYNLSPKGEGQGVVDCRADLRYGLEEFTLYKPGRSDLR